MSTNATQLPANYCKDHDMYRPCAWCCEDTYQFAASVAAYKASKDEALRAGVTFGADRP